MKAEIPQKLVLLGTVKDSSFEYIPHKKFWDDSPRTIRLVVNAIVFGSSRGIVLFDPGPGDPALWMDGLDQETRRMNFIQSGGLHAFLQGFGGENAVSDIFLTHCHPDHIIGMFALNGQKKKVYPNSRVWTGTPQIIREYSRNYLCDSEAYDVIGLSESTSNVQIYQTDIHAPRHTVFVIDGKERKTIIWGDMLPTAMHLRPKFRNVLFPEGSPDFYETLLEFSIKNNAQSFLTHDPRRMLVEIIRSQNGYSARTIS